MTLFGMTPWAFFINAAKWIGVFWGLECVTLIAAIIILQIAQILVALGKEGQKPPRRVRSGANEPRECPRE